MNAKEWANEIVNGRVKGDQFELLEIADAIDELRAERDALLAAVKAARGELVLLGKDLQAIEDRIRFRPSCLLSDETLAEIDAAIAQAEGTP